MYISNPDVEAFSLISFAALLARSTSRASCFVANMLMISTRGVAESRRFSFSASSTTGGSTAANSSANLEKFVGSRKKSVAYTPPALLRMFPGAPSSHLVHGVIWPEGCQPPVHPCSDRALGWGSPGPFVLV